MKTLKLALTFYRGFFFASLCITFLCLVVYKTWQAMPVMLVVLFWSKIVSYLFTFFHIKYTKRKEFYYYQALGVSKTALWMISLLLDFIIFSVSMYITNRLYHA
ncbi:MAG: hypothetical protein IPH32_04435 [Bacteroidetes bacterium]|nr:hypothetical protein [Bacteroidota bacterium]